MATYTRPAEQGVGGEVGLVPSETLLQDHSVLTVSASGCRGWAGGEALLVREAGVGSHIGILRPPSSNVVWESQPTPGLNQLSWEQRQIHGN